MTASILKYRWVKWMLECGIGIIGRTLKEHWENNRNNRKNNRNNRKNNSNNRKNIAEIRYFDSKFMTRPNADVLLKNVDKFIPSRNVLKLLDDKLVPENSSKIVNIWSCAQHVVHEALKSGTKSSEFDTDKILKSMFCLIESSRRKGTGEGGGYGEKCFLGFCLLGTQL